MPFYSIPFPNSPIVGENGYVSREWNLFFQAIFQAIGGPSVVAGGGAAPIDNVKQFEEYPVTNLEAMEALRGVDELRNIVASMGNDGNALRAAFDELNNAVASISVPQDFRTRLDDVEALIAGLPIAPASYVSSVNGKRDTAVLAISDIAGAAPINNPIFTGLVVSPKFQTANTSVVGAASTVATTVYVITNTAPATYLVSANIGAVNDANNYSAFAIILSDGITARIAQSNNGTLQTITLSGLNIQSTQSSGNAQTLNVTVTRIG